jgi:hypothetical protein
MSFEAAYLNAAGATLGTLKIGPVTAADRGNATGLLRRSGAGMVPGGTRSIRVRMTATEVGAGGYVHAYADNLSLTLLVAPPPTLGHLPKPVLGRLVNVKALSGQVYYKPPAGMGAASASARASVKKGKGFIPLTEPRQIPVGSLLDTRGGKLRLVSARNSAGKIQAGDFQGGIFQVLQSRRKRLKGLTTLRLKGGNFRRRCGTRRRKKKRRRVSSSQAAPLAESARRRRRTVRRLRGRTRRGRFRTRGRHSSATVRGTTWTVADRCDGTLTKVRRGKVLVRDFRRKKRIVVRQGKSYLARAPG